MIIDGPVVPIKKDTQNIAAPFGPDMHKIVCRLLGELTALPRPPSWFSGWGRPGKGNEGEKGEERKRERTG